MVSKVPASQVLIHRRVTLHEMQSHRGLTTSMAPSPSPVPVNLENCLDHSLDEWGEEEDGDTVRHWQVRSDGLWKDDRDVLGRACVVSACALGCIAGLVRNCNSGTVTKCHVMSLAYHVSMPVSQVSHQSTRRIKYFFTHSGTHSW